MSPAYTDFVRNPSVLHLGKTGTAFQSQPTPELLNYPVDTNVQHLVINDALISDDIAGAITTGEIIETMDYAAGTLGISVIDRSRKLINGLLSQWVSASTPVVYTNISGQRHNKVVPKEWNEIYSTFDGRDYALVQVVKNGDQFDLTFENRTIHEMRRFSKPKIWHRDLWTRAEVVQNMCKEVSDGSGYYIQFYAPELDVIQPVKTTHGLPTPKTTGSKKIKSFARGTKFTVKGHNATKQQISHIGDALRVGTALKAPSSVLMAQIITIIEMSNANLTQPHNQPTYGGGSGLYGFLNSTSIVGDSTAFVKHAMHQAALQPGQSPEDLAWVVMQNITITTINEFKRWIPEATTILNKWTTSYTAGHVSFVEYNRYLFKRGLDGERENSWDCAVRLAREVNYRIFSTDNVLWWVSDDDLKDSVPWDTIDEDTDGIDSIDWEIDSGKPLNELTITAHLNRWQCPPGVPIWIENSGPADGRWVVYEVRRPLDTEVGEITCHLPSPPLPEPAPTTKRISVKIAGSGANRQTKIATGVLKAASTSVPGHPELKAGISQVTNVVLRQFPGLVITATTNGTHASGSYHYLGRAVDIASSSYGLMHDAAAWIATNLTSALTEGIHNPNLSVKYGKTVAPSYWGSTTWAGHLNHIHLAV